MFDPNPTKFVDTDQSKRAAEVAAYVHAAGFAGNDLVIALAVAYAESGWQYSAKGGPNNNGTYDWGLFQINDVHKPTANEKTNPLANAKAAHRVYAAAGNSFTPWATYKSGAYKGHLVPAKAAVAALQKRGSDFERETIAQAEKGSVSTTISPGELNNASLLPTAPWDIAKGLVEKVIGFFDMSLAVLLGIVLFVLGMAILARGSAARVVTGVAKDMAKTAQKTTPKTPATPRPVKSVETRAAESLALSDAKKRLIAERKAADSAAQRAEFFDTFAKRQAEYRKGRGA
jgi:hypothetical protein